MPRHDSRAHKAPLAVTRLCLTNLSSSWSGAKEEQGIVPVTLAAAPSSMSAAVQAWWSDAQGENDGSRVGDVMMSENSPGRAPPFLARGRKSGSRVIANASSPGRCLVAGVCLVQADGWQRGGSRGQLRPAHPPRFPPRLLCDSSSMTYGGHLHWMALGALTIA